MTDSWLYPVAQPALTALLVEEVKEQAETEGRLPTAFDTPLRFSDAGGPSRRIAFDALGIEPSDGFDLGAHWVTYLGKLVHEKLQEAIGRRFPGARFEVPASLQHLNLDASGHADAVLPFGISAAAIVEDAGGRALFELKTVGGFAFDKAIGLNRRGRKLGNPQGPRRTAVLQGALNAMANDCDLLIIGYLGMESVSRQLAHDAGMRDLDRFCAEWHIPDFVWRPMAIEEMARQRAILEVVERGELPDCTAIDDDGQYVSLNPLAARSPWQCDYCSQRHNCVISLTQEVAS